MARAPVLLFAVVALVACSSSSSDPPAPPPVTPVYGPVAGALLTPFPSDRYTRKDATSATGLRVDLRGGGAVDPLFTTYPSTTADLETLDGFSTVGGVAVSFTADVDPASAEVPHETYLGPDAPAVLVDLETGQKTGLLVRYGSTADGQYDYPREDHTMTFQPTAPLRPRARHLFVLTDRIRARSGAPTAANAETRALLDGTAKGAYEDAVRAAIDKAGVARSRITLATLFTTMSVHDELGALAAARRKATPPSLVGPLTVVEGPTADGRVRFAGKFAAPEYRRPKPSGRFAVEGGLPVAQSTAELELLLAFSNAKRSGPRPVVIFAHGLGGDKEGVWGTAQRLADLDVAVIGIDAPEHGSRAPGGKPKSTLEPLLGFFGIDSQEKGKETFVIPRARDNFRQMAADQLELVRLIGALSTLDVLPVGAPDGVPDLDPSRIVYLGHSFGSVMGPTAAALAPEIRAACWNVGGAGLMTLLRDSPTFKIVIDAMKAPATPPGDPLRFFAASQALVDPGDPLNFARYVTLEALPGVTGWRARDVLLQEANEDTIVPNSTSELLARAAGLTHVLPARHAVPGLPTAGGPVSGNLGVATGVFAQFERDAAGKLIDHGSLIFSEEARTQYVGFFQTSLAGKASVAPPFAGK